MPRPRRTPTRGRTAALAVVTCLATALGTSAVSSAAAPGALAADTDDDDQAVVLASDFETTVDPWGPRGPVTLALTGDEARSGASSLAVTGRTGEWNGPATDALALLVPGEQYTLSAWVKLPAGTTGTSALHFTVEETVGEESDFTWVGGEVDATADAWVEIGGTYTLPAGLDAASLYVEAAPIAGEHPSFLVDDVTIVGAAGGGTVVVIDTDFEDGLDGWGPRGDGTNPQVTLTTEGDPRGTTSALVTGRADAWHGLGRDVTDVFAPGTTYDVSVWVKLAPGTEPGVADVRVSVQRDADGASSFDTVATATGVTADAWIEVAAPYSPGGFEAALLYVETTSALSDLMVDDVLVTRTSTEVQEDIPSLRDVLDVPIGVAIDTRETTGPSAQLTLKHFDQITPENHMKPEAIQPTEGEFTFAVADELMRFAADNDLRVYGHTLVWHSQTPDWFFQDAAGAPLTTSPADQELLRERMRTHIETFADHFRAEFGEYGEDNPLVAIDVVNEVISEGESDGLRRSEWYRILGPEYVALAFEYAREAFGPEVLLFINDYNTELPAKRAWYHEVVTGLLADGVPVDGVGHQLHLSLLQPIAGIEQSIELFSDLPVVQAVTELDVTINTAGEEWTTPPIERVVEQGYYYRDLFAMLGEHTDVLEAITVWGLTDVRSWRSGGFPLLFDAGLQAKPAYWGIVDPDELPTLTRQATVHAGTVPLDDAADAADAAEWALLPPVLVGAAGSGFQLRWAPDHLTALVRVVDPSDDGAADTVELFLGDEVVTVSRAGGEPGVSVVRSTGEGYDVVAHLPADGLAEGDTLAFDVRITDGATGERTSWNDLSHAQEGGERFGVVTLVEPVGQVDVVEASVAPVLDGEVDAVWADAHAVTTDVQIEGSPGASAEVRLLWLGSTLYALAEVADDALDAASSNPWEQDSVEIFVDPVNAKSGPFNPVDGQYRISFENAVSISGEAEVQDRLTSATREVDGGYVVEAAIDLGYEPEAGQLVGLELQVNDATDGVRASVRTWSDPTGRSYQSTSRWGVGRLVAGEPEPVPVCAVEYTVHGTWPGGFITQVWLENTGDEVLDGWTLAWTFGAGEQIVDAWSADVTQDGDAVTASNLSWNASLRPGERVTFGFVGQVPGSPVAPEAFTLDGGACVRG